MNNELCEKIKYITSHLGETYQHTVREFLVLKAHVAQCEACNALIEQVAAEKPRIGPPQEPN